MANVRTLLIAALVVLSPALLSATEKNTAYIKPRLAVIPLESNSVDSATLQAVNDLLQSRLENAGLYSLIERDRLEKVFKEQKFQLSGAVDESTLVRLGKVSGASKLVVGSINAFDRGYAISARIVDAESAEVDISASELSRSVLDLKEAVDRLCKSLTEKDRSKYQAYLRSRIYRHSLRLNAEQFLVNGDAKDRVPDFLHYAVSYRHAGALFFDAANVFTEYEAGYFSVEKKNVLITQTLQYLPATVNLQYYVPMDFVIAVYGKAGAGAAFGQLSTKDAGLRTDTTETSTDPVARIGIGFDTARNYRWGVQVEALYTHYLMKDASLNGVSLNAGISYNW